jgi:hypothetical protein
VLRRKGLLALSVGVGLGVLAELMEEEVDEVVGLKGRHDPARTVVRHGHEAGEVTLGGRRVVVGRPRVRSADGANEVALATYAHFADCDPLTLLVLEQMLAGVSTRRYVRVLEPVGAAVEETARSTSKSSASRAFVERTRELLGELQRGEPVEPWSRFRQRRRRTNGRHVTGCVRAPNGPWPAGRPQRLVQTSSMSILSRSSETAVTVMVGW